MFHPVGSQPPSVYWRRRLLVLGTTLFVLVLAVLTAVTVMSDGSSEPAAAGSPGTGSPASSPHHPSPTRTHIESSASHSKSSKPPPSSASSSKPGPLPCKASDLAVSAVVEKPSYKVGDEPVLELQVINKGDAPCVQDLADKQVELRVYNGESRVWGSHDCQVMPGTSEHTLPVGHAVRVSITWTGLSSRKDCAGTRQRVGAGTYTLYALLSGHMGKAAQFALT